MNIFEKMGKSPEETLEDKIKREAYFEAQADLSVNASDNTQANTSRLSAEDFGFMEKVEKLAQEKMHDPEFRKNIEEKLKPKTRIDSASDPLYEKDNQIGKQELKKYNEEKYGHSQAA